LGTDKRSATEFTFFLALPIMLGAFAYDFYKNRDVITSGLGMSIAIGFAAAFIVGVIVVRYLLGFIGRHGFAPFAYWRIFAGALGLWGVLLFG
jgi:undecaprenyl-diphosphatase